MGPEEGSGSLQAMAPVKELSRLEELTQQLNECNRRFNDIKGGAYDIASSLGGPWATDDAVPGEKQLEDREPTKLEKLTKEVDYYHKALGELDNIVDRLRQVV